MFWPIYFNISLCNLGLQCIIVYNTFLKIFNEHLQTASEGEDVKFLLQILAMMQCHLEQNWRKQTERCGVTLLLEFKQ